MHYTAVTGTLTGDPTYEPRRADLLSYLADSSRTAFKGASMFSGKASDAVALKDAVEFASEADGYTFEAIFQAKFLQSEDPSTVFELQNKRGTFKDECVANGDGPISGTPCGQRMTDKECCQDCRVWVEGGRELLESDSDKSCQWRFDRGNDAHIRLEQSVPTVLDNGDIESAMVFEYEDNTFSNNNIRTAGQRSARYSVKIATAYHNRKDYEDRWHHIIVTVTSDGRWMMWEDGVVVSGYSAEIAKKSSDAPREWLAHPGFVQGFPVKPVTFDDVTIGGRHDSASNFNGKIAAIRAYPRALNATEVALLYTNGLESRDNTPSFRNIVHPTFTWVPCKGAGACSDFLSTSRADKCENEQCRGCDFSADTM